MEKLLESIVEKLYNATGNTLLCSNLSKSDEEALQILLKTPSQNKGLIEGTIKSDNRGYLGIKLTELGIQYCENGFKFNEEIKQKNRFERNPGLIAVIGVVVPVIITFIGRIYFR